MHQIENEMKAAQHLLYVSLKYTKTGDVILNLMHRWRLMIEHAIDMMLEKAKKKKLIKEIPTAPKLKATLLAQLLKKEPIVIETLELYSFFRRVDTLEHIKEHEFRKNVALRIIDEKEVVIDLEKLKEWQALLENFIKFVRKYTA
ncbi:MAG: hypothetical protein QW041_02000 [Candidatus Pacearchaeota archaeon]